MPEWKKNVLSSVLARKGKLEDQAYDQGSNPYSSFKDIVGH